MSTELRNRREVRHDDKHRFDRTGHPVGDEIAVLVITGIIGKREYHFPLFYESIPSLVEYLMEVYESTEEIPDDE
jgi:cytochrome b